MISPAYKRITDGLNCIGIKTVPVISNPNLDAAIAQHVDCAAFKVGKLIFSEKANADCLKQIGLNTVAVDNISSPYPNDVALNAKLFGNRILCNKKHIAQEISAFAERNEYTLLHCSQGYAACSTVKLDDNTAITDDESVYEALKKAGIECLLISKGSIKLDGYGYGFIGGCCGMVDDKTIVFAGSLDSHSDADLIRSFLRSKQINAVELFYGNLIDFGGFIELE